MWIWKARIDINSEEWDQYLDISHEPLVEFSSWYLDICCKKWGAFFHLEKNFRIPIPYSKFLGITEKTTRPPYLQRLKIISDSSPSELEIQELFTSIQIQFRCGLLNWDYNINSLKTRANYILTTDISNYNQSQKRNLAKTNQNELQFILSKDYELLFHWLKNNGEKYLYEKDFNNQLFRRLVSEIIKKEKGYIVFVKNKEEITGAAIFTNYNKRKVFFLSFNTTMGKKNGGMVGIIHYVQTQLMTTDEILDLEGSDIPGVATFYEGFGAVNHPYFEVEWNKSFLCELKNFFR